MSFQSQLLLFPPGGPPGGSPGGPHGGPSRRLPPGGPPSLPLTFWFVPNVRVGGLKLSGGSSPPWPYRFFPCKFHTSSAIATDGLMGLFSYIGPPPLRRASTMCWVIVAVFVVIIWVPISVDRLSSTLASPIGWSSASPESFRTMVCWLGPASCPSLVLSTAGAFSICLWSSSCRIGFALVPNSNNSGFFNPEGFVHKEPVLLVTPCNPISGVVYVFNVSESLFSIESIGVGPLYVSCPLGFSLDFFQKVVINSSVEEYVLPSTFFHKDKFN